MQLKIGYLFQCPPFVRILGCSPSVSAVHAGGLSVFQLKSVVVKTLTECPLHLRSLDRSQPLVRGYDLLLIFRSWFHSYISNNDG